MKIFVPLARVLFSAIFIVTSFSHFTQPYIAFAAKKGILFPDVVVPLSGLIMLLGGLMILLGYRAKIGAILLVLFLIPATIAMHKFWGLKDAQIAELQKIMFLKNMALLGGAMLIAYFGSGPYSIKR